MADYFLSDLVEATAFVNTDLLHLRTVGNIDKKIQFLNLVKSFRDILSKNTNYTIQDADRNPIILVNSASGNITITLPTLSANINKDVWVIKIVSANNVILDGEGAETINGSATQTLYNQFEYIKVIGLTSGWFITGRGEIRTADIKDRNITRIKVALDAIGDQELDLGTAANQIDGDVVPLGTIVSNSPTGGTQTSLPAASFIRAALQEVFNRLKNLSGVENGALDKRHFNQTDVTPYIQTLLDDADAAAARTTLDVYSKNEVDDISFIDLVAGENLAADDIVGIMGGKAFKMKTQINPNSPGSDIYNSPVYSINVGICRLNDTDFVVFAQTTTGQNPYYRVGRIDFNQTNWFTWVTSWTQIYSGTCLNGANCIPVNVKQDNHVLFIWDDDTVDDILARAGIWTPGTNTMTLQGAGPTTIYNGSANINRLDFQVCLEDTELVALAFSLTTPNDEVQVMVVRWNGTTITYSAAPGGFKITTDILNTPSIAVGEIFDESGTPRRQLLISCYNETNDESYLWYGGYFTISTLAIGVNHAAYTFSRGSGQDGNDFRTMVRYLGNHLWSAIGIVYDTTEGIQLFRYLFKSHYRDYNTAFTPFTVLSSQFGGNYQPIPGGQPAELYIFCSVGLKSRTLVFSSYAAASGVYYSAWKLKGSSHQLIAQLTQNVPTQNMQTGSRATMEEIGQGLYAIAVGPYNASDHIYFDIMGIPTFIGRATGAATKGNTATVDITTVKGSGLIPGLEYSVQMEDGVLVPVIGEVPIGKAVSATDILVF